MASFNSEIFDVNKCYLNLYPNSSDADAYYSAYTTYKLTSSSYSDYKEALLMGGIFFSLGRMSFFDFRFMAGNNFCRLAGYSMQGISTTDIYQVYQGKPRTGSSTSTFSSSVQPANSSAFAGDFGFDCHFLQRKHIIGLLSCDFMYSRANFNTTYNNITPTIFQVNYYVLSFTAGIGYKL
jgi:hypothetical protein